MSIIKQNVLYSGLDKEGRILMDNEFITKVPHMNYISPLLIKIHNPLIPISSPKYSEIYAKSNCPYKKHPIILSPSQISGNDFSYDAHTSNYFSCPHNYPYPFFNKKDQLCCSSKYSGHRQFISKYVQDMIILNARGKFIIFISEMPKTDYVYTINYASYPEHNAIVIYD